MESIPDDTYAANELYKYVTDSNKEANKFNQPSKKGKEKNRDVFAITQSTSPIESLELIDLKFRGYGVEDELYLIDDKAFSMLRRGSSLTYHKETKEYHIARAGLVKFFDYKKHYDSKEKAMKRRVTLPMVESKKKQSVYLTEKANGENFQVSYNKIYSCYIVGSKNVTIAIRNEEDIKWYEENGEPKDRYSYVTDFAKVWLSIVEKKIGNKIEEFKNELGNHTLIGESVGDLTHQHIKLYSERDVIFYAIVDNFNTQNDICLSLKKSFDLFKRYNLSYVPIEPSPQFESFEAMVPYINSKYDEVLLRTIENGGEGCVAYFVENDEDGTEHILNLAKLKTFDYRFYRKLREITKGIRDTKRKYIFTVEKAMKKIEADSHELLEGNEDKVDFKWYMTFAKYFFEYCLKDQENYSDVFAEFVVEMRNNFKEGIKNNDINIDEMKTKLTSKIKKDKKKQIK